MRHKITTHRKYVQCQFCVNFIISADVYTQRSAEMIKYSTTHM